MMNDRYYRYLNLIAERLIALQSDGYYTAMYWYDTHTRFIKLRHRSNGHTVTISANLLHNYMKQWRDDILKYEGEII